MIKVSVMVCMSVFPSDSHVESLTPSVMVFGRGAFGRPFGLFDVMTVVPS